MDIALSKNLLLQLSQRSNFKRPPFGFLCKDEWGRHCCLYVMDTSRCFWLHQLKGKRKKRHSPEFASKKMVGVARFELAAPCSQNRCANRTALYPDNLSSLYPRNGLTATSYSLLLPLRFFWPSIGASFSVTVC